MAQEFGNLPATTRGAPLAQPLAQEFGNQTVTPCVAQLAQEFGNLTATSCVAQLAQEFGRLVWPNWFKNPVRELLSVGVSWNQYYCQ